VVVAAIFNPLTLIFSFFESLREGSREVRGQKGRYAAQRRIQTIERGLNRKLLALAMGNEFHGGSGRAPAIHILFVAAGVRSGI
jgi:hypothetical protein